MDIISAKVETVYFGIVSVEGLYFEDGRFGVSVPQLCDTFPYFKTDRNNASTLLKRLMGKDFKTDKVKTIFNKNATSAIDLLGFERVLRKLDRIGDPVAQEIADALIGLSLTQIFADSFYIEFGKKNRQAYLADRIKDAPDNSRAKHFNKDWQNEASRVTGYKWQGLPMANFIHRSVYLPLGTTVVDRLNIVNPCVKGTPRRENFHYKYFDIEIDEKVLKAHISEVLTILKMSQSEIDFWRLMANRFNESIQPDLELG